jgi:predicted small lipoprotein YifL
VRFVMSRFDRLFPSLAAVALALLLAGCGLKGALDPPPSATPTQAQVATVPGAEPAPEDETKPQAARKRIFLDRLLD